MRFLPLVVVLVGGAAAAFAVEACSSDPASTIGPETDGGGTGSETGPGDRDGATEEDGATNKDATTETDACAPTKPSLNAGGGCGTMEFGVIAAPFGPVTGGNTYAGGTLAAGVYDAVGAERASGSKGSWRETLVSDGAGHFTRIRQIDTGLSDASLGPVTRRSGTYTTSGTNITMTYDCAQSDGVFVDAGSDTLPYEATTTASCESSYRYGVTGIRITLKRR